MKQAFFFVFFFWGIEFQASSACCKQNMNNAGIDDTVSVEHPVDMTQRIVNPQFDNNDVTTGWSGTGFQQLNAKDNAECYMTAFKNVQRIDGLPMGVVSDGAHPQQVVSLLDVGE